MAHIKSPPNNGTYAVKRVIPDLAMNENGKVALSHTDLGNLSTYIAPFYVVFGVLLHTVRRH